MSNAIATREDWKTLPMPAQREALEINLPLTAEELRTVVAGHIPFDMDDKWFIYFEEPNLFFHRSWTGTYIYHAVIKQSDDGSAVIVSAEVNRDSGQYKRSDSQFDQQQLVFLVERVLLGRDVPFPFLSLPHEQNGQRAHATRVHRGHPSRSLREDARPASHRAYTASTAQNPRVMEVKRAHGHQVRVPGGGGSSSWQ